MAVAADSYMTLILPEDILQRIADFIASVQSFPFVRPDELMCLFYLYGRTGKADTDIKRKETIDLASRTAAQVSREIENYSDSSAKADSEFIRSKYVKRQLQLVIDRKNSELQTRIAGDPVILSD